MFVETQIDQDVSSRHAPNHKQIAQQRSVDRVKCRGRNWGDKALYGCMAIKANGTQEKTHVDTRIGCGELEKKEDEAVAPKIEKESTKRSEAGYEIAAKGRKRRMGLLLWSMMLVCFVDGVAFCFLNCCRRR